MVLYGIRNLFVYIVINNFKLLKNAKCFGNVSVNEASGKINTVKVINC